MSLLRSPKKNSCYQYSPDRKTKEGKEIVKLWNSWAFDNHNYKKAMNVAISGQVGWGEHTTAKDGMRVFYASLMAIDQEYFLIVPRNYDNPFKKHKDLTEIKGSQLIKVVAAIKKDEASQ